MFNNFLKIIFFKEKKYFLFVFLAVFLSLFSYILWNNIILWVNQYLKDEIKPLVWWDIVLSTDKIVNPSFLEQYALLFKQTETIEIDSTIFDENNKPILYKFVYHKDNYPFYETFEYDTINPNWVLIVNKSTYDTFWSNIKIFDKDLEVKWIITKKPLWEISLYTNDNKIYLPIEYLSKDINENNSRLSYKIYLNFLWKYDEKIVEKIKNQAKVENINFKTINERQDSIWEITDRFYLFINAFNLVIFILTFFIIILSLESFFKKNKSNFWLLNIFWLTKKKIFLYCFIWVFFIFISSFIFAVLLNILVLELLKTQFSFFVFYLQSFTKWISILFILLIVWLFSPLYKLKKSNINNLLKDTSDFSNFTIKDYIIYLSLIFFWFFYINIVSWISIYNSMIYTIISLILVVFFYLIIKYILLYLFRYLSKKIKDFYIFDSIRSTIKPGNVSFLIIFSSIISFLSIFIFFVFSWSFLSYLSNITNDSNDMFVLNAQQSDLETINKYFTKDEIYEIVSLRIKTINNKTLNEYLNTPKVSWEFSREFFSTTNVLENKIINWKKLIKWWVSVDEEFASRLWLNIWDKIVFSVAWLEKQLEVINFRESVRNWANPFFFFQLNSDDFINFPRTYILSYKQSKKPNNLEKTLVSEIKSNLTFINTKEVIDIVIDISNKILKVVYFSLFYIFIFSFLSFLVSILFLKSFKDYKIKLLNLLWWNTKKLFLSLKIEYFYLIFIWLIFSILFWTIILFSIFYFINYFSISYFYYFLSILLLFIIFLLINSYIYFFTNKKT